VHRVAVYALDRDTGGARSERIDVIDDATGAVLSTATIADFEDGVYLVWNISGDVTIEVTNLNPASNAVLSGLFLGGALAPLAASASIVTTDAATQGNGESASVGAPQYVAPSPADGGRPFQVLATVPIASGTPSVVLANAAEGGIDPDAVSVIRTN
jgi:hypothetical protein